jgi:hypothetical protein
VYQIVEHEGQRYVGEMDRAIVHDTWHSECETCLVEDMIARGVAVGFEPDRLDQAFWEGFEYCDHCFDRTEPLPPPHRTASRRAAGCG